MVRQEVRNCTFAFASFYVTSSCLYCMNRHRYSRGIFRGRDRLHSTVSITSSQGTRRTPPITNALASRITHVEKLPTKELVVPQIETKSFEV